MKRKCWILLTLFLLSLAGCGGKKTGEPANADNQASAGAENPGQTGRQETAAAEETGLPALPEYTSVDPDSVPDSAEEDFIFNTEAGWTCITGYQGAGGQVKIPKSLGGGETIVITGDAFKKNESITWLYLPETVHRIPERGFLNCKALEEVIIAGASEVEEAAFKGCEALRRVELGEGCQVIGGDMDSGAFQSCASLTEVVFPSTLTRISTAAFMDCQYLETADLSGTQVSMIGQQAFTGCTSLKNLSIPASLVVGATGGISSNAFLRCPSIGNVQIAEDNPCLKLDNGVLYQDTNLTLKFQGYDNPDVVIAEGTTSISTHAFQYDEGLKSVVIPDSVTSIGSKAFYECSNLERVTFGAGLVSIEDSAFMGCKSLKEAILPDNEIELGSYAFSNCRSLEKVFLPQQVKFYGDNTLENGFSYCENAVFTYKGKEYTFDMAAELDAAMKQ